MNYPSLNRTLLAGVVISLCSGLFAPVALAACDGTDLNTCPAPFDKQLPDTHKMLTWSQADRVVGFRNDYRNYAGDVFHHGNATPLPSAEKPLTDARYQVNGKTYNLQDYLKRQNVSGMLVLKDGKIAWKYLGEGNTDTTLWTSRSVGKSVVSTLVGVALKEGKIRSLDDLVTQYEPDLKGTAWDGVTLKQLITHTSGVAWNEDYTNPASDFAQLTECEAKPGTYDCVRKLVSGLKREHPAGQHWSYSSGGAWLLGDVLERATGMTLAAYLEKSIWQPYGMASDGVWHAYRKGQHDVGAHGFNATLEDWGRFGEFILHNGTLPNGKQILPDNWVKDASRWTQADGSVSDTHPTGLYGYQWWNNEVPVTATKVVPAANESLKGSLWALGIFGQMIMVNQAENLVIVQWSTWPQAEPSFSAQPLEASLMFSAIANALR
ncbi:serine hydrolase domain-containing protein [Enterobacter ludwigii]|uniref:serine hydrolase domain-containing protein n=1 Tax=Enterobacter ludwigii TaxID=299767 RepID=UPI002ACA76F2|nr:serine hydrolase [Enterobacter ludwigii]MDZ5702170.1 serine hydrolase [Enterobacter ludwigii]